VTRQITSPIKAIRAKCVDCSGGSVYEVKSCPITDCPLYVFRAGKNPFRKKRVLTPAQRENIKFAQQALKRQREKQAPQQTDQPPLEAS